MLQAFQDSVIHFLRYAPLNRLDGFIDGPYRVILARGAGRSRRRRRIVRIYRWRGGGRVVCFVGGHRRGSRCGGLDSHRPLLAIAILGD